MFSLNGNITLIMIDTFAIIGACVSSVAAIIAMIVTRRISKKYDEFVRKPGDVISPQRSYVENRYYITSTPLTQDPGFFADANHILLDTSKDKDMLYRTKLPDFSFFEDMAINLADIKVDEKMVMCLMPFHRKYDKTKATIASACEEMGYKFRRSDDELIEDNTDLRKSIVRMILESRVVIAVLDGRNPNVFYEIGIAHSVGKLVLMVVNLSREENKRQEVDLLSNRLITYNNTNELKEKLIKTLQAIHYDDRGEEKTNS